MPRREFPENLTACNHQSPKTLLKEITRIFSDVVVFYVHSANHQKSLNEIKWMSPEFYNWQKNSSMNESKSIFARLAEVLVSSLKLSCGRSNIVLDLNKFFENLHQLAQTNSKEPFPKVQLFFLLYELMYKYREYYLSVPCLRNLYRNVNHVITLVHPDQTKSRGKCKVF